ncbi:MAG: DUF5606 domain-containing protein [Bacteroidales bacterium]|nr:DUF5606 domain-containing protein [Bacteroidales bacterium]
MDLSKILSISGRPGLYKHIAQSKNSAVVESLEDGKRSSAFITEQISSLNDISVFTTGEDIKLEEIFKKIFDKETGKKAISHNASAKELKTYFSEAVPEYDKDRVYVSDIKKIIKWYNTLIDTGLMEFEEENQKEDNQKEEIKSEDNN